MKPIINPAYVFDIFPALNGLKQSMLYHCHFSTLLQNTPSGDELNRTHQLMVYGDDINTLSENINIIKKNTGTLLEASKEVSVEVNTEKTKYMVMSCHHNAGQNHNLMTANKTLENVAKFKYAAMRVKNQNYI
jgi:hypothetical protein